MKNLKQELAYVKSHFMNYCSITTELQNKRRDEALAMVNILLVTYNDDKKLQKSVACIAKPKKIDNGKDAPLLHLSRGTPLPHPHP